MFFWCLQISKKPKEMFSRISALGSKMRSKQKVEKKRVDAFILTLTMLFWFELFLKATAEILSKIPLFFLGQFEDTKTTF